MSALEPGERLRLEATLAEIDAALARFATYTQHKSAWRIAATLANRGITLVRLERFDDGLAVCGEVVRLYGGRADPPAQVLVAGALLQQGVALTALGRPAEAAAAYQELLSRFGEAPGNADLEEIVAAARRFGATARSGAKGVPDVPSSPSLSVVQIREARPAELERVTELTLAAFREYHVLLTPRFVDRFQADIRNLERRAVQGSLLVADLGGRLAGTVTLLADGSDYGVAGWPAAWPVVRLLAVDPAQRGHGVGRLLAEACVARARGLGAAVVGLHTAPFMSAARAMYEGLGFERAPEFDVANPEAPLALAYLLGLEAQPTV